MVEGRSAAATNNLGYWLSPWAAREPDRLGIIDLHGGAERRFTYGELERALDQVAAVVRAAGIGVGERVILSLGNRAEFMLAMYGVMRAGAVPVPLNTRQGRDVLDYSIGDCEPVAAIVEPAANEQVAELCAARPMRLRLMLDGTAPGWEDYAAAVGAAEPLGETVRLPPDAVCFFSYTSGSTGKPKGVPLTHAGQIWWLECLAKYWRQSPDARSLVAMPLYHKNAMAGAGKPRLFTGASMVVMPGFEPRRYLETVERHRVTHLTGVPTLFARILQERDLLERLDLSSVTTIGVGSAPVQDALFEAIRAAFPNAFVFQSYGLTEGGPVMIGIPTDGRPIPLGSCGVAWPEGECKLLDAEGRVSESYGELWVRNPGVTPGYHNQPEVNAKRIVDGWLKTGDLFRKDEAGFYYFMGRTDDMFVCGGENVYPIEVESLLLRHPAVGEACVVPVPYGDKGEAPVAMVSLRKGEHADEAELKRHCLALGPAFAHPRRVVIVDELPLSGARKIDRALIARRMRELCADLA